MENNNISIQWTEETLHLSELSPYEKNPRKITEVQFAKLKASLITLGQFRPLLVTHDLKLAGGHQRLKAMKELGWTHCRVSIPDREITAEEYRRLLLQDNHENGTWDIDALANDWDFSELQAIGIHEVMNIAPMDKLTEEEMNEKPKAHYKCPECSHVFAGKGNKADV